MGEDVGDLWIDSLIETGSANGADQWKARLTDVKKRVHSTVIDLSGGIAQLVERLVRNEKVRGSNPLTSTNFLYSGHPTIAGH
jgi:hypothetical protein